MNSRARRRYRSISLIYRARESGVEQPSFELWDDAPASKAKLIVIDECSMVDAELGRDLMSFECPLLVLGDPAQLPPIQGGGFFTACEPDAMLTEVRAEIGVGLDDPVADREAAHARGARADRAREAAVAVVNGDSQADLRRNCAASLRGVAE